MCVASSVALVVLLATRPDFFSTPICVGLSRALAASFRALLAKMRFVTGQPSNNPCYANDLAPARGCVFFTHHCVFKVV
jgi:hypothetical protein